MVATEGFREYAGKYCKRTSTFKAKVPSSIPAELEVLAAMQLEEKGQMQAPMEVTQYLGATHLKTVLFQVVDILTQLPENHMPRPLPPQEYMAGKVLALWESIWTLSFKAILL